MQGLISNLNKTIQKTDEWLTQLANNDLLNGNKEQAYTILRSVLHTIRDRLSPEQAVHFSAEFPLLIKGIYFDGWNPAATPTKERTEEDFLDHIAYELQNASATIDPKVALQVTFQLLKDKISSGIIEKVKNQLPKKVSSLITECVFY